MGGHEIALARLTFSWMPDLVAMELWGGFLGQPHIKADVLSILNRRALTLPLTSF